MSDAHSRWAYPVGVDADASFHGSSSSAKYALSCDRHENEIDGFPSSSIEVDGVTLGHVRPLQASPKPSSTIPSPFHLAWDYSTDSIWGPVVAKFHSGTPEEGFEWLDNRLLFLNKVCVPKGME